jgi:exosome complex component RRP42
MAISSSEMMFILQGCRDNIRLNGRAVQERRSYTLLGSGSMEGAPLVLSNGSARILLPGGETHILCSIKAELVHPSPDSPDQGVVELHVDTLYGKRQDQLESSLSDLLLDHVVDKKGLCVVPHHYVWRLHMDLMVFSCQGSLLDVCSRVMRAALQQTKLPHIVPIKEKRTDERAGAQMDLAVDGDIVKALAPAGVEQCPILVTVNVMQCPPQGAPVLLVDATLEEEACVSCQVRVVVDPNGRVCALDNQGPLGVNSSLPDIVACAVKTAQSTFQEMKTVQSDEVSNSLLQNHFQIR